MPFCDVGKLVWKLMEDAWSSFVDDAATPFCAMHALAIWFEQLLDTWLSSCTEKAFAEEDSLSSRRSMGDS